MESDFPQINTVWGFPVLRTFHSSVLPSRHVTFSIPTIVSTNVNNKSSLLCVKRLIIAVLITFIPMGCIGILSTANSSYVYQNSQYWSQAVVSVRIPRMYPKSENFLVTYDVYIYHCISIFNAKVENGNLSFLWRRCCLCFIWGISGIFGMHSYTNAIYTSAKQNTGN